MLAATFAISEKATF